MTVLGDDLSGLERTRVAAIGPATAATAEECGIPPHVVAEDHTIDGLVDALRTDAQERAAGS